MSVFIVFAIYALGCAGMSYVAGRKLDGPEGAVIIVVAWPFVLPLMAFWMLFELGARHGGRRT